MKSEAEIKKQLEYSKDKYELMRKFWIESIEDRNKDDNHLTREMVSTYYTLMCNWDFSVKTIQQILE